MKEKNKKIFKDVFDIVGYSSAISYTGVLGWLIYKTRKNGGKIVKIASTKYIGIAEVIGAGCTVGFLLYKLISKS